MAQIIHFTKKLERSIGGTLKGINKSEKHLKSLNMAIIEHAIDIRNKASKENAVSIISDLEKFSKNY